MKAEAAAASLLGGLTAVLVCRARWRRRPIVLFDPHFHVWDIREPEGYADTSTLFSPEGASVAGVYDAADFERDWASLPPSFVLSGGVFVEAVSCCFKTKSPQQLAPHCLKEAEWVQAALAKSPGKKEYFLVATACLEDPSVGDVLAQLAANKRVRGIRQVLNVSPDWPRNGANGLGELLDSQQWHEGYAKLAGVGFAFDLQLNPHQYQKGAALVKKHPDVPVIIDHLGTPTLADLQEPSSASGDVGATYWRGMTALARAGPHVHLKISMLCYIDPKWDENALVRAAVARLLRIFGPDRCFFASNYPVDLLAGQGAWTPDRLYPAFLTLAREALQASRLPCDDATVRALFRDNARRAYGIGS